LLLIGLIVALASAIAKGVHYMVTFFVSGHLGEKRRQKLDTDAAKIKRWAFPLLFIVAATPIPDEPVVIPLGLMKYSPVKFFSAYFLGKLTIAVAGAFLGNFAGDFLSAWFTPTQTLIFSIVFSIVLTVVVTIALFKVDWEKLQKKYIKPKKQQNPLNQESNQ
jgi:membrane protein DedA with SNARE-associated domain